MTSPLRGHVYRVDLGHGAKPWLVVSNNRRNAALVTVVAARITSTDRHVDLPTVVPLAPGDPLVGWVLCDDLVQLDRDELSPHLGSLGAATMRRVSAGLRVGLP